MAVLYSGVRWRFLVRVLIWRFCMAVLYDGFW